MVNFKLQKMLRWLAVKTGGGGGEGGVQSQNYFLCFPEASAESKDSAECRQKILDQKRLVRMSSLYLQNKFKDVSKVLQFFGWTLTELQIQNKDKHLTVAKGEQYQSSHTALILNNKNYNSRDYFPFSGTCQLNRRSVSYLIMASSRK
jgi:hypothetical protein